MYGLYPQYTKAINGRAIDPSIIIAQEIVQNHEMIMSRGQRQSKVWFDLPREKQSNIGSIKRNKERRMTKTMSTIGTSVWVVAIDDGWKEMKFTLPTKLHFFAK